MRAIGQTPLFIGGDVPDMRPGDTGCGIGPGNKKTIVWNVLEEADQICKDKGLDVSQIVKDVQPIAFENAAWAYICGAAIAIKKGETSAADIAKGGRTRSKIENETFSTLNFDRYNPVHFCYRQM